MRVRCMLYRMQFLIFVLLSQPMISAAESRAVRLLVGIARSMKAERAERLLSKLHKIMRANLMAPDPGVLISAIVLRRPRRR